MKEHQHQLAAMKGFLNLCTSTGITAWLTGGWGIDFLLGRETRVHSDIDFMANRDDYSALSRIISGFADTITLNSVQKMKFSIDGIRFDICFFFNMNGNYVLDLNERDPCVYPMPANSFPTDKPVEYAGLEANVISWDAQYVAKRGFYYCSKEPLREKDMQDLNIIQKNLSADIAKLESLFPGVKKGMI